MILAKARTLAACVLIFSYAHAALPAPAQNIPPAKENVDRVKQWNDFVDGLFLVHRNR
jgi:hypothetical protein